jgi:hypothetical protein
LFHTSNTIDPDRFILLEAVWSVSNHQFSLKPPGTRVPFYPDPAFLGFVFTVASSGCDFWLQIRTRNEKPSTTEFFFVNFGLRLAICGESGGGRTNLFLFSVLAFSWRRRHSGATYRLLSGWKFYSARPQAFSTHPPSGLVMSELVLVLYWTGPVLFCLGWFTCLLIAHARAPSAPPWLIAKLGFGPIFSCWFLFIFSTLLFRFAPPFSLVYLFTRYIFIRLFISRNLFIIYYLFIWFDMVVNN